ncbi:MAG TPA: dihydroorotate dehydrogenase [Cyanobacteria bacterium UBA8530]|nr:dihydroorotate dehydrogenase [Cyanobacteria bacterium UBA8530]
MKKMKVNLGPLQLNNPIALASGTCGYGLEMAGFLEIEHLGGIFTKGLTYRPSAGNPPERIAEAPMGMINRIGLQNVGVEEFLKKLPRLARYEVPIIANVAGATVLEYCRLVERLSGEKDHKNLAGLELNVSCPNVEHGGMGFGTDPHVLERLVSLVRAETRLPLIVKLTPNVTDVGELARAAEAGGADVLSAINTVTALSVRPRMLKGKIIADFLRGGLSGPAIKPIALRCVHEAFRATKLPIIGIGGITSLEDVLEFIAAGASAVQIGTASLVNPGIACELVKELEAWLVQRKIERFEDILPMREVFEK